MDTKDYHLSRRNFFETFCLAPSGLGWGSEALRVCSNGQLGQIINLLHLEKAG